MKTLDEIRAELPRILSFIRDCAGETEQVVVPVSGGLDSDVVARLCVMALGAGRVRLFVVRQPGMEDKYLFNARTLAEDLRVRLAEISLGNMNRQLICALQQADPDVGFDVDSLLDPARANASLRTALISSYQDKGYLIAANTNRTEMELGFFLPFGDNLGHFKPIAHLYKSEVRMLAQLIGVQPNVISQPPSAGFWEGEEDLEDIAYWLHNQGPIKGGSVFTDDDDAQVEKIRSVLTQERVDLCVNGITEGKADDQIAQITGLPVSVVEAFRAVVNRSAVTKNRPLLQKLRSEASCCIKN